MYQMLYRMDQLLLRMRINKLIKNKRFKKYKESNKKFQKECVIV